jgi:hypothetical protein
MEIKGLFSKPTLLAMWNDIKRDLEVIKHWEGSISLYNDLINWRSNIENELFNCFGLELGEDGNFHKVERE